MVLTPQTHSVPPIYRPFPHCDPSQAEVPQALAPYPLAPQALTPQALAPPALAVRFQDVGASNGLQVMAQIVMTTSTPKYFFFRFRAYQNQLSLPLSLAQHSSGLTGALKRHALPCAILRWGALPCCTVLRTY